MLIPNKFNGYTAGRRTYHTGMEPILAATVAEMAIPAAAEAVAPALAEGLAGSALTSVGAAAPEVLGGLSSLGIAPLAGGAGAGTGLAGSALTSVGAAAPEVLGGLGSYGIEGLSALAPEGYLPSATEEALSQTIPRARSMYAPQAAEKFLPDEVMSHPYLDIPEEAPTLRTVSNPVPSETMGPQYNGLTAPGFDSTAYDALEVAKEAKGLPSISQQAPKPGFMDSPTQWWKSLSDKEKLLYGGGAGLGLMSLMNRRGSVPGQTPYTGPLSKFKYDPSLYTPAYIPRRAAAGGTMSSGVMARGGIADLGSYSDGGRLLKGPGDGMSDNIPATISNKRPARLADGEFVVPADVVSHLGNGSTDAGAKQLYAMMDKVRSARTGRKAQGKQIKPQKYMPA